MSYGYRRNRHRKLLGDCQTHVGRRDFSTKLMRMRKRIRTKSLIVVVLLAVCPLVSPQSLGPDTRELVDNWLRQNCGMVEAQRLATRLAAVGSTLEPVFWQAYVDGPPTSLKDEVHPQIVRRYALRQTWLKRSADRVADEQTRQRLSAIGEAEYVNAELERLAIGYRTAAIKALGIVGTAQSLRRLLEIASDPANSARTAAATSVTALRNANK